MFDNSEELKEFVIWAKGQRVLRLKVGEVEIEFSTLAFIDDVVASTAVPNPSTLPEANPEPVTRVQDDPDLFHSV